MIWSLLRTLAAAGEILEWHGFFSYSPATRWGVRIRRALEILVNKQLTLVTLTATLACGCTSGPRLDNRSTAVTVAHNLPAPDTELPSVSTVSYRIAPRDEIAVSVFGAPELDKEGTVDAAGNFSMPLAGTVAAAGKTPHELGEAIAGLLRGRYLKNPRVAVNIKAAQTETLTVDGAVREPGVYPITGVMTLQQAIATAKGADETANISNVIVFRTVKGQRMAAMFNLRDVRSGRYPDPQVYGSDIIIVGENAARRFFKDATMSFPMLAQFFPVL